MKRTEGSSKAPGVHAEVEKEETSSGLQNGVDIEKINVEEYLEPEDSISQIFKPNFGDYTINPPLMPLSNHIALLLKYRRFVVKPTLPQRIPS